MRAMHLVVREGSPSNNVTVVAPEHEPFCVTCDNINDKQVYHFSLPSEGSYEGFARVIDCLEGLLEGRPFSPLKSHKRVTEG